MRPVLACCFILSACGGKPDPARVRIADTGPVVEMTFLPVSMAETLGYFREEGLDVVLEKLPSSGKTLEALLGGSADVASLGYMQTIQMATRGQRIRAFFIGNQRANFAIVASPGAQRKVERIQDLDGALIGVPSPGSPTNQWASYYLTIHGVDVSRVKWIGIGGGAGAIAALGSGRMEAAALAGGNHIRYLKQHPDARLLVDGSSREVMLNTFGGEWFASGALAARQEWLDRNPDTAKRLCRALGKALRWIATHAPEEIRDRLPESSRSADVQADIEIIRWGRAGHTPDGRMPAGAPEAMFRFLEATSGEIRGAKIDLSSTWTNEFLEGTK